MGNNEAFFQNQKMVLFDKKRKRVGSMGITVAIAKDCVKESSRFHIKIDKVGKMYVPEDRYISTDPIPEVWIDIFSPRPQSCLKEEILDSS